MNASMECLKGVWILKELAEAIGTFEFAHNKNLDELAGDFVAELVKFSYNILQNQDNFKDNSNLDKADFILSRVYQFHLTASSPLYTELNNLQLRFHPIELGDEIDNLLNAVVKSVVYTFDEPLKPHSYHEVLASSNQTQSDTDKVLSKYILIDTDGIHEIEAETMPTRDEIAKLVGIPGEETYTFLVNYPYSDPMMSIVIDVQNETSLPLTCKTSQDITFNGQIMVVRIDPEIRDINFLTPEQIELIKRETEILKP